MPIEVTTVAHGAAAFDALAAAVRAAKDGDPLRPVAVVVPTNTAGVTARRAIGRRGGAAAVEVLTVYRLAELLGAPTLLAEGRRPVSTPVVDLAVRQLLARSPGLYAGVATHPSTIVALRDLYREIRMAGTEGFTRLGRTERGREPARVVGELARVLTPDWYDEADLLVSATERAATGLAQRLTRLVVHLPERLSPLAERLLRAVGAAGRIQLVVGLTGEPAADDPVTSLVERLTGAPCPPPAVPIPGPAGTVEVVSTTDADDEVRLATRAVVDAARRGTRFDRMAVVWPADRPYARLVEHHLTAAGVPWNGRPGAHVSERMVPRLLAELLELDRRGVRRAELMNLLGEIPARRPDGHPVPVTAWERLTRRAGVIRDSDWDVRLPAYVGERQRDGRWVDDDAAEQVGRFVTELRQALGDPGERRTWTGWRDWTEALLDHWLGKGYLAGLTGDEREAWEAAQRILDRLADLDTLGGQAVTRAELRATFVAELEVVPPRRGAVGDGVHVGTLGGAAGLDVDMAVVLGAREGLLPPIPAADPLLGEAERRAAGLPTSEERTALVHHHLLAVVGPTPRVTITVPRGDLRAASLHHPSRWIAGIGTRRDIDSHAHGLATVEFPVSAAEHRARQLWVLARAGGDIRDHPAHHDDVVLRRAVAMLDARAGVGMTEYDGDLSSRPTPPFIGPVSPTAIEQWVKCPHAYFVAHVLGVYEVEEPADIITVSALERGRAIHDAIDRLQQAVLRGDVAPPGPDGWTPAHQALLHELAEDVADDLEARGVAGRAATWATARPLIIEELGRWIEVDRQHWGDRRLLLSEQHFGGPDETPVDIELPDGRRLAFVGAIDRVVELPDGTLLVTDHKTSKVEDLDQVATDPTVGGTRFQLPVYAAAARALLGRPEAPVRAEFAFFSRGRFARHGVTFGDATWAQVRADLAQVVAGIDAGVFPSRPKAPGFQRWVDCACCDPDGLGTAERFAEWERTRTDPRLPRWFPTETPLTA